MIFQINAFSKFILSVIAVFIFFLVAMWITAYPRPYPTGQENIESFVSENIDKWRRKYAFEKGLKVARIDIHFRVSPKTFVKQEGAVITPVGLDLPGFQKVIETVGYPPAVRELPVDGINALAWAYTGKCRDDYHYVALCLVRQSFQEKRRSLDTPSFFNLPKSFAADALATARDLEEHDLHECSVFSEWAEKTAGTGTYIDQFKRIVQSVSQNITLDKKHQKSRDDICAAIRHSRFTIHRAQVVTVMACRELNIPCFGFTAAMNEDNHIVGTFSDHTGWLFFDMNKAEKGFFTDPPVLLTMAPLISGFKGGVHDYWYAQAAAYESSNWGIYSFSTTKWGTKYMDTDVTLAQTFDMNGYEK